MKTTALLVLLLFCSAHPAPVAPARAVPFECEGAFFALSVADLAASRDWYREKLGLRVVLESPPQGGAAVTVLEGGGLVVELLQLAQARPLAQAAPGVTSPQLVHGYFKAGMIVKDLGGTLARLRQRGVQVVLGPFPASDTQRANAIVQDNAGNLIQLFGA
jgi:catechol 2,3-dioxygenase-like lactoylglutathione lyase family enzyme